MATYFMFGKYSLDSVGKISAKRSDDATALVKSNGGEIKAGYALLGEHDLVIIVDFPNTEQAIKTSIALTKMLGVSMTTAPAISMADFDKLAG